MTTRTRTVLLLTALILGALLFSCHHPVRTLGGAFSVLRDRTGNGVRVGYSWAGSEFVSG